MPRLPPPLIRRAKHIAPELATLLPACRTLQSASNELRWLREHVDEAKATATAASRRRHLSQICRQRGRGVPLQYILGTQPFGHLDIQCRPGVLIPRPETEVYTCHLVDLLRSGALLDKPARSRGRLGVIDFCTGTGCIPLLTFASLQAEVGTLNVRGVDISPRALDLAKTNAAATPLAEARDGRQKLQFSRGDVFSDADMHALASETWDVMISNPPYVSTDVWNHGRGQLGPSVRRFEPLLALVPGQHLPPPPTGLLPEDIFYSRLVDVASILKPRVLLLEIGEQEQASRVVRHCLDHDFCADADIAMWRDWPDLAPTEHDQESFTIRSVQGRERAIPVKGSGNVRSILIRRRSAHE